MPIVPVNKTILKTLVLYLKWFLLLVTYSFLGYKLYVFEFYDALLEHFQHAAFNQYFWLLSVFMLLPINLFLETAKWKKMIEKSEIISFRQALNAVLAGFATGFVTPNRIGEMGGRMLFISAENRKITAIYSLLNSFTQNYIIALVGLPAAMGYFFYFKSGYSDFQWFLILISFFVLVATLILFFLPKIVLIFNNHSVFRFIKCVSDYKSIDLLMIAGYSLLRFLVFGFQFYAVLRFFGVELSGFEALMSIPTSYLLVTFTPALAFSEAAIRSSYSVLIMSAFSDNTAGIAFAGFLLWAINFVLPMLLGSRLIANTK